MRARASSSRLPTRSDRRPRTASSPRSWSPVRTYSPRCPLRPEVGTPELARTPEWIWSGSEIGAEAKWGLGELENRLTAVGATFADVVDYTLFLTDASDLFEWDAALKAAVGDAAPSRTVIPSRG